MEVNFETKIVVKDSVYYNDLKEIYNQLFSKNIKENFFKTFKLIDKVFVVDDSTVWQSLELFNGINYQDVSFVHIQLREVGDIGSSSNELFFQLDLGGGIIIELSQFSLFNISTPLTELILKNIIIPSGKLGNLTILMGLNK